MKAPQHGTSRRDEIAAAAARLFDEQGYHTTSMDDIAKAIGIKKPSLYHHVQSKTQIVIWIHDELVDDLTARLESRLTAAMPRTEVLRLVMLDIFELLDTKPGHLRVYFEHHREIPGEEGLGAKEKRDAYTAKVRQLIEEGAHAGEFAIEDPSLTTFAFFGIANWAYQWYRPHGPRSSADIAATLWRTFVKGIGADAAPPVSPGCPAATERL